MIPKFLDHRAGDLSGIEKPLGIEQRVAVHTSRFCGAKALASSTVVAILGNANAW
jgi:hypothetical protein